MLEKQNREIYLYKKQCDFVKQAVKHKDYQDLQKKMTDFYQI